MFKKEMYHKTARMHEIADTMLVTQKIDGSNLCFFKYDGELFIAQRKTVYSLSEIVNGEVSVKALYPGLYGWFMNDGGLYLARFLHEGSVICCEWLGMGKLKYPEYKKQGIVCLMFAKARFNPVTNGFENYDYELENFRWVIDEYHELPQGMDFVPIVARISYMPDKANMDKLYDEYCAEVQRPVEGFVISWNGSCRKYLRYHNGKPVAYSEDMHKGEV